MALAFDATYYLQQNPDVAAAISRGQFTSAQQHYDLFGRFENRNPSAYFSTSFYLSEYPDVARAGVNPLTHFLTFGLKEGRIANGSTDALIDANGNGLADEFNATAYLSANPDVAAAVNAGQTTAYKHFIEFGQFEGRTATLTNGTVLSGPLGNTGAGGSTFSLTAGADSFTGTAGNDTFNAFDTAPNGSPISTLTVGDALNGGAGTDTLNIVQNAAFGGLPVGASVSNIENVNVTSAGTVAIDTTTGFSGVTALKTVSTGANTVTAGSSTSVNATATTGTISINGGTSVTASSLANTGQTVTIGNLTAPTGAVNVTSTTSGVSGAGGAVAVTGGSTVSVAESVGLTAAQKAAALVNGTTNASVTQGAVTVTGTANTTSVSVVQDKAVAAVAGTGTVGNVGVINGNVTITDVNAASTTAAGTINTVSLTNFGAATVNSGALTTLNLSGTGTSVNAGTLGALTTAANTALALNVNGLTTTGAVTIDTDITTLNVASSTAASTLNSLSATGVKTLNISGDSAITFTADTLASSGVSIVSTNTAGVTLGSALAIDTSFTGGAGADSISLTANFTKAVTTGAGNDTVVYAAAGTGGSVAAGDGIDTIVMTATQADGTSGVSNGSTFNSTFSGFEVLKIADGGGATTVNLAGINGVNSVITSGATGAQEFDGFSSGGSLTLSGAVGSGGSYVAGVTNASVNTNDTFNITLSNSTTGAVSYGTVTASGIETLNLHTGSAATGASASITLTDAAAKSLVVDGSQATTINFSSFGTAGTNGVASINGSAATGALSINLSGVGAATSGLVVTGGSGADIITTSNFAATLTGGAGLDKFNVAGSAGTGVTVDVVITDLAKGETITFADKGNEVFTSTKVDVSAATSVDAAVALAATGDGSTNATVKWFQYGGDTYVVDHQGSSGYSASADTVVKLTGLLDLSNSSFAGTSTASTLTY